MDVSSFAQQLFRELAARPQFQRVISRIDGPVIRGQAVISDRRFLQFFYNSRTGTLAFALIDGDARVWGIDFDNRQGWHLHPIDAPNLHLPLRAKTVAEIFQDLDQVMKHPSLQ